MKENDSNIHAGKTILPKKRKRIFCTVTTDLSYDQRMIRICTSLAEAGYDVTLVGRKIKKSIPLINRPFRQKRIACFFEKGKLFYAAYNLQLFFFLLFKKMDCIVAIDLDTILPCYFISKLKKITRVYDAHELFCEMKEIATRPAVYTLWKKIEKFTMPKFPNGYTVNESIAAEFNKMYAVKYEVIRNIALLKALPPVEKTTKFILYQGAVNEGRCFETLIPAMNKVDCPLIICGEGNFMEQAKQLVNDYQLQEKVIFKGRITPDELIKITRQAYIGITLFDNAGLSNYYSLANRFFDYLHAGIPQLCVNFPVYQQINEQLPFALLTDNTGVDNLAAELNNLLHNEVLYKQLQNNCDRAREIYNWQGEAVRLVEFYNRLLAT